MNPRSRPTSARNCCVGVRTCCAKPEDTLASLSAGGISEADLTDRASVETDRALELRTRDRARKLISKIDQALERLATAPTATARNRASRSASAAWKPGPSPPSPSRRRSATSGWSGSTGTIEKGRKNSPFRNETGTIGPPTPEPRLLPESDERRPVRK
jgi:BMFP domain-containing protein YqiC